MTLQETERITGLRRTLIRRYERFGFIRTKPQVDGGRTYTKEQIKTLLRVRLLRQLMISEGEIRKVQKGYYPLCDLIKCCLEVLEKAEDSDVVRPLKRVCEQILQNNETFDTLRAYSYLVQIQGTRDKGMYEEDGKWWLGYWGEAKPEPEYPNRRLVARMIDMILLWAVLFWIIYVEFSVQPRLTLPWVVGMWALHTVLYILLDAACMTLFATTPGKLIERIRVYNGNGDYLTWKSSLRRSFRVMAYGMGWNLPVWNLFCMYCARERVEMRSKRYTHADALEWEEDEWYEYRGLDFFVSESNLYVMIGVVVLFLNVWNRGCLPVYRGDITIRQFAENRNVYARYLDELPERELSTAGKWVTVHKPGLQDLDEEPEKPEYNYYYVPDKNRILQQVVYKEFYTGTETVQLNTKEMATALWSFLGTDPGVSWLNMLEIERVVFRYADSPTQYEIQVGSIMLYYELVLRGMQIERVGDSWQISPEDPEQEGYYSAEIKMVRQSPEEETDDGTEAD